MAAAVESPPANLYGAAFIGLIVTAFLSGIMTLQVHFYYQHAQQDRLPLKLLVAWVWILDMTHLVGITVFVYHFTIANWGNTAIIGQSTWTLGLEEMLNTWITFTVQMFFIYRIGVLSRYSRWTLVPLYLFAFVQLGFGTGGGIKSMLPQTVGHLASTRWRAGVWLVSGAVNDLLIATILCYYLYCQRNRISSRLVDQLIAYAINTGLLTSFLAFVDIGCFIAMPGNYIHLAFNFTIGRVYTNSLMGTLNVRQHLRKAAAFPTSSSSRVDGMSGAVTHSSRTVDFAIPGPGRRVIQVDALPHLDLMGKTEFSSEHIQLSDNKSKVSLPGSLPEEAVTFSGTAVDSKDLSGERAM